MLWIQNYNLSFLFDRCKVILVKESKEWQKQYQKPCATSNKCSRTCNATQTQYGVECLSIIEETIAFDRQSFSPISPQNWLKTNLFIQPKFHFTKIDWHRKMDTDLSLLNLLPILCACRVWAVWSGSTLSAMPPSLCTGKNKNKKKTAF